MSYRITLQSGQPRVEVDSAEEAAAFIKRMTPAATSRSPIVYQKVKRTTHKSAHKSFANWLKDEVFTLLDHLNERTREIARYLPRHTYGGVQGQVYLIRRGEKASTVVQGYIDEYRATH